MLLCVFDGRVRVWRRDKRRFAPKQVQAALQGGGGSVTIWGCVSYGCDLDLVTAQGTLTWEKYPTDILNSIVVPYFNNLPVYMDDNARPRRNGCSGVCLRGLLFFIGIWTNKQNKTFTNCHVYNISELASLRHFSYS